VRKITGSLNQWFDTSSQAAEKGGVGQSQRPKFIPLNCDVIRDNFNEY
jgi:hypothetical protein